MIAALLATLVLAAPAPASAPTRVAPKTDLDGDGVPDAVRLERRGKSLYVVLDKSAGGTAAHVIGDEEIPFQLDGRESRLTLEDVTKDGRAEILVAATAADRGFLYVLTLRDGKLESLHPDSDAFVSETGSFPSALAIDREGRVTIASLDHSEEAGPREALFTFEWNAKAKAYKLAAVDHAEDD